MPVSYTHLDVYKRQVFLILFPRDIVDRLVLVVQGWVFAGKEQGTSQYGNDSFKLPALCPACFPVWSPVWQQA